MTGRLKRAWLTTIKHTVNPLTLRMARRGIGPFSLVRHVGRRSAPGRSAAAAVRDGAPNSGRRREGRPPPAAAGAGAAQRMPRANSSSGVRAA